MPETRTYKTLTTSFQSMIDIALIAAGVVMFLTGVSGIVLSFVGNEPVVLEFGLHTLFKGWLAFILKSIAGAIMILAPVCSIGWKGRVVSAIAIGYCICQLVYCGFPVQPIVGGTILLVIFLESLFCRNSEVHLKSHLEANALRVTRALVILSVVAMIFTGIGSLYSLNAAIGTLAWKQTEATLVANGRLPTNTSSAEPHYRFEVEGESYKLLADGDPKAAESTFHFYFRGKEARESGDVNRSQTSSKPAILPKQVLTPKPTSSIEVIYNPNRPSDNIDLDVLWPARCIFGFMFTLFSISCWYTFKTLNGTRNQFTEPKDTYWSSKPYVKIGESPATTP